MKFQDPSSLQVRAGAPNRVWFTSQENTARVAVPSYIRLTSPPGGRPRLSQVTAGRNHCFNEQYSGKTGINACALMSEISLYTGLSGKTLYALCINSVFPAGSNRCKTVSRVNNRHRNKK
ncbi:hypothetical protein DPMN_114340 [Dreissena polymorpha]|uniref:Uncharacterized protein n=1 Tax=Dreissena polymorpha TaxID=45954 RepID=A0A9D4KKC8_DREPO|nr:hypothetical protein DPMN_114340 [Dreissena polymorpha]